MREWKIETEADSLEEAKRKVDTGDVIVLGVTPLKPERVTTVEGIANTIDEAVSKAKTGIPAKAEIYPHKVKADAGRVAVKVHGDNEESARQEIKPKKAETIESITLRKKARKGFLGFFKRRNLYEVVLFQQAVVEITFRERAGFQARVRGYLAKDLLESIKDLRGRNVRWEEAVQSLNPKNDVELQKWLNGLTDARFIDPPEALNILESLCRMDEEVRWKKTISEARDKASSMRAQLWVELRGLDVEIADLLTLYKVIRWEPKTHKEPTGIRREDYGHPHHSDEKLRTTIPDYSTNLKAFAELERKLEVIGGLGELYEECLREEGLKKEAAPLRRKCEVIVKARRRQLKR
jgi:hypothetical protein